MPAKKKAPPQPNPYKESMRGVPQDLVAKKLAQQRRAGSPPMYGRAPGGGPQRLQTGDTVRGNRGQPSTHRNGPRLDYVQPGTKKQAHKGAPKKAK